MDCKMLVDRFRFYTTCSDYSLDDYSSGEFLSNWLSALRILRLFHYSRPFHICRSHFFSKLMMMASAALTGMRAIGWSVILVPLPVHATATFFRQMIGHNDDQGVEFESLIASWMTMRRLV